ncbi:PREDICTED: protein HYPER-SENSITIVITY-RELATED 4-like [Tarenaya hassleriana]|uniref:protein HYPER-SENSITIVITY-RELATED 4-like n=1 Tax=Tarenaya hassleriana TaxID=28532 RepID=UPI00053C3CFB|nr:PREDICTED: protein HYPER-SENSITIVITY-RELATED 4-like [Tarenaya hassleriana]
MSFFSGVQSPGAKSVVSLVASAAATAMLVRSVAREYIPHDLSNYTYRKLRKLFSSFSSELTVVIEELDGMMINRLFKAAELYLEPALPPSATRIRVSIPSGEDKTSISMEGGEEIIDNFDGVRLKWRFLSREIPPRRVYPDMDQRNSVSMSEQRFYELRFDKKHRELVLGKYIEHIMSKAKESMKRKRTPRLFTLSQERIIGMRGSAWEGVPLRHPARFETLAMDDNVKKTVMEDLEMFVKRRDYYRKVGKAWKRGYLLFGPPGTGKSSLIAAMADHLQFDVYDLELTQVRGNSELKKILMSTGNKSILVVEDIDCSVQLRDRLSPETVMTTPFGHREVTQVTLSGFLNFVDGLWSSCGDERIIIFTTNHKERLDHALLRPGRMDVHVHMSYCTPCGLRLLVRNYLGVSESDHDRLLAEAEDLLLAAKATPAEVAEELMKNVAADVALERLIEFLKRKKSDTENETKTKIEE